MEKKNVLTAAEANARSLFSRLCVAFTAVFVICTSTPSFLPFLSVCSLSLSLSFLFTSAVLFSIFVVQRVRFSTLFSLFSSSLLPCFFVFLFLSSFTSFFSLPFTVLLRRFIPQQRLLVTCLLAMCSCACGYVCVCVCPAVKRKSNNSFTPFFFFFFLSLCCSHLSL